MRSYCCTGSSKNVFAKLGEESSVGADGVCFGGQPCVIGRQKNEGNSNMEEFFSLHCFLNQILTSHLTHNPFMKALSTGWMPACHVTSVNSEFQSFMRSEVKATTVGEGVGYRGRVGGAHSLLEEGKSNGGSSGEGEGAR